MTATCQNSEYQLYHSLTETTVTFSTGTGWDGEAKVYISTTVGNGNWSGDGVTPAAAREFWKAWLRLGAVDLRKHAVIDGSVYKREAGGLISSGLICTRYEDVDFAKYAPKGYAYARHEDGGRDEYMASKEVSYKLYFKPVAAA